MQALRWLCQKQNSANCRLWIYLLRVFSAAHYLVPALRVSKNKFQCSFGTVDLFGTQKPRPDDLEHRPRRKRQTNRHEAKCGSGLEELVNWGTHTGSGGRVTARGREHSEVGLGGERQGMVEMREAGVWRRSLGSNFTAPVPGSAVLPRAHSSPFCWAGSDGS